MLVDALNKRPNSFLRSLKKLKTKLYSCCDYWGRTTQEKLENYVYKKNLKTLTFENFKSNLYPFITNLNYYTIFKI